MIEMQREYARDLLTHVNPFTGNSYASEPAVAFIEINNENSLIHEWWGGELDRMPDEFATGFRHQWNAWLGVKYGGIEKLRAAWQPGEQPPGAEMTQPAGEGLRPWSFEHHGGSVATCANDAGGFHVVVEKTGAETWNVQLNQPQLKLSTQKSYTISFRAKSDRARRTTVGASLAHEPWTRLWSAPADLTPEWKDFRFTFTPDENEDNARVGFPGLGRTTGEYFFSDISLKPGGVMALREGERFGAIDYFRKRDWSARTAGARRDWLRFLWKTEQDYWEGMARFIKADLKAKSLVVGTQMGYSPFPIQARLDVIDVHSCWQHPHFPRKQWDPDDWTVSNIPMTNAVAGGNMPYLALHRVAGKPYICTEYNHPAPNTYSSEAFLLLSAYGAMQDWDAVFAFAYSHRKDEWDLRRIPGFFDIDQHPTKMATLPAAVALFCRGDVHTPGSHRSLEFHPPPQSTTCSMLARASARRRSGCSGVGHWNIPWV